MIITLLRALAKLIYHGTIWTALFLFSVLVLIELAALWQWCQPS